MRNLLSRQTWALFAFAAIVFHGASSLAEGFDYGAMEQLMGEPVTGSATGTPQTQSDVATDMTIITADEIRQSGSRSIPEILSRVPGLDVLQESTTGFDVGVRGYQQSMQPGLLVLIDGRQVFSDDYARTIWENLPVNVDDIRQIEVTKGPSSALFGSNAAHGVVNIITYDPFYDHHNTASGSLGTQNTLTGDATAMTKFGDLGGAKISVGGLGGSEFNTDRPASEQAISTNPEHKYLVESNVFQLAPKAQAFTEVTYSQSNGTEGYYNGQLAGVRDTSYSVRGGGSWDSPFGTLKSNNYVNVSNVKNDEVSSSLPVYSDQTTAFTSQLEDDFKWGPDHTFRTTLEYNHKDFTLDSPQTAPTPGALPANAGIEENNYAVGGMWLWRMDDQWELTNALRLDHFTLDESGALVNGSPFSAGDYNHSLNAISANSSLLYKATPLDTVQAIFGRGVEMPSLLDYGFNNFAAVNGSTTQGVERSGNPILAPTIVTSYELSYQRKIDDLLSAVSVSVYYELDQDIISPFPTTANPIIDGDFTNVRLRMPSDVGDSHGIGGELEIKGKSQSGFRWDASYSYTRVRDSASVTSPPGTGAGTVNYFGYDNSAPYHHFRLLGGYTVGPWEFDINSQLLTDRILLRSNATRVESDGYFTVGGRIGYKVTDAITAAVSGTSINEAQVSESPYPAIERQLMLTLTAGF